MKKLFFAFAMLTSLVLVSCEPNEPETKNPLVGTTWSDDAMEEYGYYEAFEFKTETSGIYIYKEEAYEDEPEFEQECDLTYVLTSNILKVTINDIFEDGEVVTFEADYTEGAKSLDFFELVDGERKEDAYLTATLEEKI